MGKTKKKRPADHPENAPTGNCTYCHGRLRSFGDARLGGRKNRWKNTVRDWPQRTQHLACWKFLEDPTRYPDPLEKKTVRAVAKKAKKKEAKKMKFTYTHTDTEDTDDTDDTEDTPRPRKRRKQIT